MVDFAQALSGFVIGIIVGVTGVGGGSLMTPVLVMLFGIHPATAVGTDLLHAAITKAGGTVVHARNGNVEWAVVSRLAAGSVPAAVVTLLMLHHLDRGAGSSKIITTTLGVMLLLTAVTLIFRSQLRRLTRDRGVGAAYHPAFTVLTGAILGIVVSLSSIGAGAIGITALFGLYPRLAASRIVGSDLAHAVPLALVAGFGYWLFGAVNWTLLGSLLVGSLPGIYVGSQLSGRLPELAQRSLLAITLSSVGVKLIAF
ncbi:MAG: sulfite exporter TauE/SafE family protein [Steroidobacteraceae bacterium]|jgi:uncharacterized membrane protein YfcA